MGKFTQSEVICEGQGKGELKMKDPINWNDQYQAAYLLKLR